MFSEDFEYYKTTSTTPNGKAVYCAELPQLDDLGVVDVDTIYGDLRAYGANTKLMGFFPMLVASKIAYSSAVGLRFYSSAEFNRCKNGGLIYDIAPIKGLSSTGLFYPKCSFILNLIDKDIAEK